MNHALEYAARRYAAWSFGARSSRYRKLLDDDASGVNVSFWAFTSDARYSIERLLLGLLVQRTFIHLLPLAVFRRRR